MGGGEVTPSLIPPLEPNKAGAKGGVRGRPSRGQVAHLNRQPTWSMLQVCVCHPDWLRSWLACWWDPSPPFMCALPFPAPTCAPA